MDWPGFEQAGADSGHEMLAPVEAEVGPLVERLPVPVLVTSGDGAVLRVNPPAAALLGCADGLVGRHVDRILEPRNLSARMTTLCHEADAVLSVDRVATLDSHEQHDARGMVRTAGSGRRGPPGG